MEGLSSKGQIFYIKDKCVNICLFRGESSQMKEYIMNVSALEISLATHEQQYEKVLQLVDNFRNYDHISSKIRRRVRQSHITSLQASLSII